MNIALALHAGAGNLLKKNFPAAKEKACREGLEEALTIGYQLLEDGASAIEAVEATVNCMEDNPLFNAGRGGVFNAEGRVEMDASIMSGSDLTTGAIAAVRTVKNPISLARQIMEHSKHVFFIGEGAELKAKEYGLELREEAYFQTEFRREQWERLRKYNIARLDHSSEDDLPLEEDIFGTVGAVALDQGGNLAAATSTGGITNKEAGRIGDSPIIGAGTYANNATCAISSTGYGEFFIRAVSAYDIHCLMAYKGLSLEEACMQALNKRLGPIGGEGGFIAVDYQGNISFVYNTPGMFRASISSKQAKKIFIWEE